MLRTQIEEAENEFTLRTKTLMVYMHGHKFEIYFLHKK